MLRALDTVRDPELDEPVTSLGFVASCELSEDGVAEVHLRLPTYFCAPNFAFLMVADAFDAIVAVPTVRKAVVVLDEHFASDAINEGVAARAGFAATFGDEAVGELDTLRANFIRKAVLAGTDRVCRPLLKSGTTYSELATMTLGQVPASAALERLRARRREIQLRDDDAALLLVDVATGESIGTDDPRLYLGRARLTRVNIEANGSVCRGMLLGRYGIRGQVQEDE
ncbi:MAG: iron-sulfur cluster assembly protein [Actinomycetota bacterium]|nr:iron-sulfur cluster assembly protein [Actinomycetota bacterium]